MNTVRKSGSQLNAIQRMFRFTGMEKGRGFVFFCVFAGVGVGSIFDRSDTHKMVLWRDRSALYGGHVREGVDPPSWPTPYQWWL